MSKTFRKALIPILILIIALLVTYVLFIFAQRNVCKEELNHYRLLSKEQHKIDMKEIRRINEEEERIQNILVTWIYKNSSNISKTTSKEIAINLLSTKYPLLIACIIKSESNFNPSAKSKKGAIGLGQIMKQHEKRLINTGIIKEFRDIYNIYNGIMSTEYIFTEELKRAKGDVSKALEVYVGGNNSKYINQIITDFFKLHYKCKYQKEIQPEKEK